MSGPNHVPVMLEEALALLQLRPGAVVVDGTLGLAGHSLAFCRRISPSGLLVATDWDKEMLRMARTRLEEVEGVELSLHHADYRELPQVLDRVLAEKGRGSGVDAVFLDLGLNNAQIEDPERGISFSAEGPLDMRMDRSAGRPLSDHLARLSASEIEEVLFELGDERWAKRIAQVIVERRKQKPLLTTTDLVDCILAAVPANMRDKRIHPATRSFMALRIYVNDELEGLEDCLVDAGHLLAEHGVMVVLSYHSGEDRAAKLAVKRLVAEGGYNNLTRKPLVPSQQEVARNPKSRSAKLRAVQRGVMEDNNGRRAF